MGYITALFAELIIKEGKEKEIIKELSSVLKCEPKFNKIFKSFVFKDLNFWCKIDSKEVYEIAEKYKEFLIHFVFSLWNLDDYADDLLILEKGKWTRKQLVGYDLEE